MPELMQLPRALPRARSRAGHPRQRRRRCRAHRELPREQPRRAHARVRPRHRRARAAHRRGARAARHVASASSTSCTSGSRPTPSSIKNQIELDLEAFAKAFVQALPAQIDAVDADDVKTYLPAFIEDKFKEWAEVEGAKLAAMLEHLAEEVIPITNENVAAAAATLAERLGPEDTQVDITVDSVQVRRRHLRGRRARHDGDAVRQRARRRPAHARRADPRDRAQVEDRGRHPRPGEGEGARPRCSRPPRR